MFKIMRDYAVSHVWCSPQQDNQVIMAAARITRKGGDLVSFPIMTRTIKLPKRDKYYHVYKVGQANPALLGLIPNVPDWQISNWKRFSDAMNDLPLFVDVYTDKGKHIPLHETFYMYTPDRALIFCVELNPLLGIDYDAETVYLRAYTNAYYQSVEANGVHGHTKCLGLTVKSIQDILSYQTMIVALREQSGAVWCFVNGDLRETISPSTCKIGDIIEVVQDLSVKRVVTLAVSDLHAFDSERDQCFKYLLHYPETTDEVIDFSDDIDVYVLDKNDGSGYGRYLHQNKPRNLRMVTYRDYSIPVDNFHNTADDLMKRTSPIPVDLRTYFVRIYIRNSGFNRPLVYEHQRMFELYKLNDEKVKQALTGLHSVVDFWSARELENSAFMRLMGAKYNEITTELIEEAFGYNAISKYLGDTPTKGQAYGEKTAFYLPPGLTEISTAFEYDTDGRLLEWHTINTNDHYVSSSSDCEMIEVISGEATDTPSVYYGTDNIAIPRRVSFRIYRSYLNEYDQPDGNWIDVTDTDLYTFENNVIRWLSPDTDYLLMVRTDHKFLCYEFDLVPIAGTLYFDLSENSGGVHRLMPVPAGDLDIWLNGKSLIYGLDYFLEFPRLYIVNKDYLVQPAGSTPQKITVRFTGFAENTDGGLKPRMIEDFGFIEHETLSNNNRYNVRDDKVLRITVKGQLKHRDDVIFSEEHDGVSIINAQNGLPYQVKEIIVPLIGLTQQETYALRQKALIRDKAVSDYMTIKLPQPERNALSAMYNRHRLVSPFLSHLINDLHSGQFDMTKIRQELTDDKVLTICKPYEWLLKYDPMSEDHGVDQRFVVIHPHQLDTTIGLDMYSYAFIKRVIKLYARGLVVLAQHITRNGD